jgi:hypothetical protein
VRTAWLAALAALLLPASAMAQSADAGAPPSGDEQAAEGGGGDQLPPMLRNPRELSGIARGEQSDPAGRLTVRIVQGAMKQTEFGDVRSQFPVGAKVHLVGYDSAGKITLRTEKVDQSGRAVFDGVSTSNRHSHMVVALLPREGAEDRLLSKLITMPPQVGMRMILAGEAPDSKKPAVDDLGANEQAQQTPNPGQVVVHLRGDTKDVQEVELLEAGKEQPVAKTRVEVADSPQGKELVARFEGVATGADKVYVARAADQPRAVLSVPFQMTSALGAGVTLIIAPPVLFAFHGGGQIDDENLFFQLQVTLFNPALTPHHPGPRGLSIPLAHGFMGASVSEDPESGGGTPPVRVDEGRGLVWNGPIPPGERRFLVNFGLPTKGGAARFDMPMPIGLFNGQLFFDQVPGMKVEASGAKQQTVKGQDGRPFVLLQGLQIQPGQSLTVNVAGLPQHPAWKQWVRNGIGLVVLGLLGWGVWGVALRSRRGRGRLSSLEEDREELLEAMVQLEADLRRQRVDEKVYEQRRDDLKRQLEDVYAQLAAAREEEARSGDGQTPASR